MQLATVAPISSTNCAEGQSDRDLLSVVCGWDPEPSESSPANVLLPANRTLDWLMTRSDEELKKQISVISTETFCLVRAIGIAARALASVPCVGKAEANRARRQEAGRYLRLLRERIGLTQVSLARRVGLKYYTFVSQIESGQGRLPFEQMRAWADALGVPRLKLARDLTAFYEPELYDLLFGPNGG